jgi:hypothetical protein
MDDEQIADETGEIVKDGAAFKDVPRGVTWDDLAADLVWEESEDADAS